MSTIGIIKYKPFYVKTTHPVEFVNELRALCERVTIKTQARKLCREYYFNYRLNDDCTKINFQNLLVRTAYPVRFIQEINELVDKLTTANNMDYELSMNKKDVI